jgi:restriction system protein
VGPEGAIPLMAIPDYQTFMRPLLEYAVDGTEKKIGDAIAALSDKFHLTDEERAQMLPSGKQTIAANRVHWARTYLHKAGALENTRRSYFRITDRGRKLLATYPERVDVKVLRQFPEFVEFQSTTTDTTSAPTEAAKNADIFQPSGSTPDERITSAVGEIAAKLETDLLDRIEEKSPAFFESLVVDLIVAMGYGGSRENVVQRIGKSGDEGIDGIVNEDPLGLDVVYIQAKKYDRDQTIGREKIQQFAGALVGKNATKGVFVATCGYSKGAIEYAQRVPQRLILIDGKELARLLIRYGVGVRVERDIQIKRIDLDYFDTQDE